MSERILVAGVGNIFFGDDGFGSDVARELANDRVDGVKIEDFGIAGMHLGFELLAGYERAIIIDLVARGGAPGTLYVFEPDVQAPSQPPDGHRMDLPNVFALVRALGGEAPPVEIVGCEPLTLEAGIGLSEPVTEAVAPAVALVRKRIARALSRPAHSEGEPRWLEA